MAGKRPPSASSTSRRRSARREAPPSTPRPVEIPLPEVAEAAGTMERPGGPATERSPEASPRLTGGDVDADLTRAASVGEEAVGGTVATPDQSVVDDLAAAWGVQRGPEEEVRTAAEMLDKRDAHRGRESA